MNEDPVSYSQAINSTESDKCIDVMKEELKSMKQTMFEILLNCQEIIKESGVNGSLRQSATQKAILKDIKPDLLLRVILRRWH